MKNWSTFLSNVCSGIYYFSVKHESPEQAKSHINLRIGVVFFIYYFSLILLLLGVIVKVSGTHKIDALLYAIVFFGFYFILYKYLIYNFSKQFKLSLEDSAESIKKNMDTYKYLFLGGFAFMALALFIIA